MKGAFGYQYHALIFRFLIFGRRRGHIIVVIRVLNCIGVRSAKFANVPKSILAIWRIWWLAGIVRIGRHKGLSAAPYRSRQLTNSVHRGCRYSNYIIKRVP